MLLVLALMGLLVGVVVSGAIGITDEKPATAEDVFWKAVQETRRQALLSNSDVRLTFSSKTKERAPELVAVASDGTVKRYPFENAGAEVVVDFLSTQKARSASLHASQLVETNTMPGVTFFGDGTCTPFRVQFRTGGSARQMNIDPWTCAQVLPPDESKRGGGR